MAPEIERKFLLDRAPDCLPNCASVRIEQGYLAIAKATEVRLRKADGRRLLTAKRGHGQVREEVESDCGRPATGCPSTGASKPRSTSTKAGWRAW